MTLDLTKPRRVWVNYYTLSPWVAHKSRESADYYVHGRRAEIGPAIEFIEAEPVYALIRTALNNNPGISNEQWAEARRALIALLPEESK